MVHVIKGLQSIKYIIFISVVTCNDQYCYYLLKSTLHWSAAREKCRSFKAGLLSVRDVTENQWIVNNILKNQTVNRVHLGKSLQWIMWGRLGVGVPG